MKKAETYPLFVTQPMFISARSREDQSDADLLSVQNPKYALVRTSKKGQPDADLHPGKGPEHNLVSNMQEEPARC